MSAIFYSADLGIDIARAGLISGFIKLCYQAGAVDQHFIWTSKNGGENKCVRIYMKLWSQNSLAAIKDSKNVYYCPSTDRILYEFYGRKIELSECNRFSGARTRRVIQEFMSIFDERKWQKNT